MLEQPTRSEPRLFSARATSSALATMLSSSRLSTLATAVVICRRLTGTPSRLEETIQMPLEPMERSCELVSAWLSVTEKKA